MKHIIIPTDFSIHSLSVIHSVVAANGNDDLKITLLHLLSSSSDISELMFRSMRNKYTELITENFTEACEILQNRYNSRIKAIYIKFAQGDTVAYVKNFLTGEQVDAIAYCPELPYNKVSGRSINPVKLFAKTGFDIQQYPLWNSSKNQSGINAINMLQGNEIKVQKKESGYVTQN